MKSTRFTQTRLGDHIDLLCGHAFKSSRFTDDSTEVPLVKGANVHQGYIDWADSKYWPRSESNEYDKYFLQPGDVVLAMDRPWIEAGLKYSWIRPHHPKALLVQRVARMRGVNGLESAYLRFLIGSQSFTDYIKPIVTGINVPHISADQIKAFQFELPPLGTQRKIASILSAYDDLIENNTRRIATLEAMAQAIYREWFVEFRFPGHEKVKLVDSPLGKIPEGWEVVPLDDAVTEIIDYRGKTPKKLGGEWSNSGIIALSAMNVKNGRLVKLESSKYVGEELYSKWMKSEVKPCDILMTSEAPLGEAYYVTESTRYCLSQRLFSIRANPAVIMPSILYLWLQSVEGQKQIHARATGTTVTGIRQSQLRSLPLLVPHIDVQKSVHDQFDHTLRLIHSLTKQNQNLRTTRDLLLPKLISGQLDVEHLDIDIGEPAAPAEEVAA